MNNPFEDDEDVVTTSQPLAGEIRAIAPMDALTLDRASIDSQIATAKAYPRDITLCLRQAKTLATLDQETATSMFYALERKDENGRKKVIPGPSVRLAEVMAYSWGNLRTDAEILGDDRKFITARGTCFDLEKNVAARTVVRRRITTKTGKTYGDDMVGVTGNAAASIAFRNAVFRTIPRTYVQRIYELARKAALGEGTMVDRRRKAIAWFVNAGMKTPQVYALIGVKGDDDIGDDEILVLLAYSKEVRDGETTIEKLIRKAEEKDDAADEGAAKLNDRMKAAEQPPVAAPTPVATSTAPAGAQQSLID